MELEDDLDSIKWVPIAHGSESRNIRPIVVNGDGSKVLLWLSGPWRTYIDYESDVVGIVLQGL